MAPRNGTNLSRPTNRLTKPRTEASQSSRELSEWEASEEKYCANECDLLSRALTQPDTPLPLPSANEIEGVHFIGGNEGYYGFDEDSHTPIYDETDSGTESDDSEHSLASDTDVGVTRIAGEYNQRRRIREERQWEEALEPMFKVFMICKLLTFDWSQSETWNYDTKDPCRCSVAKKRIRHLGFVDILSVCLLEFNHLVQSITDSSD